MQRTLDQVKSEMQAIEARGPNAHKSAAHRKLRAEYRRLNATPPKFKPGMYEIRFSVDKNGNAKILHADMLYEKRASQQNWIRIGRKIYGWRSMSKAMLAWVEGLLYSAND